ncbi:hypothetical protein CFN17_09810 [Arthrobacter sp. PM3]|nr:hypothetical protein CFN17_09810 [Arthrobacter sp. PM3]
MISRRDALAAGQGQEDFCFALCQRIFRPVSPPRHVDSRRVQRAAGAAGSRAIHIEIAAGRRTGPISPTLVHRGSPPHLSIVMPGGTSLFRRAS